MTWPDFPRYPSSTIFKKISDCLNDTRLINKINSLVQAEIEKIICDENYYKEHIKVRDEIKGIIKQKINDIIDKT